MAAIVASLLLLTAPIVFSMIQSVASSLINAISGKGVINDEMHYL